MSTLTLTRHAVSRTSQRGIRPADIELIRAVGTEVEGGFIVLRRNFQSYEREQKQRLQQLRHLVGKRLVCDGNTIMSAYHARPAKERRLLRGGRDAA